MSHEREVDEGVPATRRRWLLISALLVGALASGCSNKEPDTVVDIMVPPVEQGAGAGGTAAPAMSGVASGSAGSTGGSSSPPGTAPAAGGRPGNTAGTLAGMSGADPSDAGDAADAGPGAPADAAVVATTGTLPVPDALDGDGPFEVLDQPDTGPGNQYRLFAPQPLGENGLEHPIVVWSPGAGAFPDAYLTMLTRLASQGFVTLSYNATAEGPQLVAAIDWLIAENERQGSVLYGKLDTTKIAAGGHSAGSLATYQMADDARLTTTLHLSGGSFTPATDVPKLHVPALMVCGDAGGDGLITGDLANPMCAADFAMAKVPVFYAVVVGAGHTALNDAAATIGIGTEPDDPKKALFLKAMVGWLRWQLAGDESLKPMFVGPDCALCAAGSGYMVMQKNLN